MQHVLHLKGFDRKWLEGVVDKALEIKKNPDNYDNALRRKTLLMLFEKPSTRTRLSFEVGMEKLGGHAIFMETKTSQLGLGGLEDEAKAMSCYPDAIMARVKKHATVAAIAKASKVPVINGLCEKYHPCQALADVMTIKERLGKIEGVKVVYLGIGNNVSNSLSVACAKLGAKFTLCAPEKDPDSMDPEVISALLATRNYHENSYISTAVKGADILYTDTWVNMEFFDDPAFAAEKARRESVFKRYQLNRELLEMAGPQAFSMHDMPAHIGYEIDEYALRGPRSLAFVQAENRMWAQMALLVGLIGAR
jgi:ornithine carbamoyltransferase